MRGASPRSGFRPVSIVLPRQSIPIARIRRGKGVFVKNLQDERRASRVLKKKALLLNQDQLKACLGESVVNKTRQCELSGASLEGGKIFFWKSPIEVKDRKIECLLPRWGSGTRPPGWMGRSIQSERSLMKLLAVEVFLGKS